MQLANQKNLMSKQAGKAIVWLTAAGIIMLLFFFSVDPCRRLQVRFVVSLLLGKAWLKFTVKRHTLTDWDYVYECNFRGVSVQ